ncbi:primosomal protein N' [Acidithiobacillus sp. AMEEHan]|uniref:primosomal protein N' n=1 Tax=Acidithiobacillus sp. AMEEHan TaxID=2994951 RepID=UPI0027E4ADF2|nr:primosomal protein N' [Acidithiobacillus sp. AMEEHan]
MNRETPCIKVVILGPLPQTFTYRCALPLPASGCRLRVPFGRGERIAIAIGPSACPQDILVKEVSSVLDCEPLLPSPLQALLEFGSHYYHHPLGAVWETALPARLCRGHPLPEFTPTTWRLRADISPSEKGLGARQIDLLQRLREGSVASSELGTSDRQRLRQFLAAGWIEEAPPTFQIRESPLCLHPEQASAVAAIRAASAFQPFLLDGVTGSGKTEVYLQAMEPLVSAGKQVLFLVPEIGLIAQTQGRCAERFGADRVAVYHSGQSDVERLRVWTQARQGRIAIVIGTRSAVFVPLLQPALLIVDEEHDPSYKQQSGWLYSARDLALRRAQLEDLPIVLGSATPSLESLHNRQLGRYRDLRLSERASARQLPPIEILPLRKKRLLAGLDPVLLSACAETLASGRQALFFLNRRGYAPALLCHACGHVPHCRRCSAPLTWHRRQARLRCHHCGLEAPVPAQCPNCGASEITGIGMGTEGLEDFLRERFPDVPLLRIDRDEVHSPKQLAERLQQILHTRPAILLGTQLLSKGHHFPDVSLVGIVDVDQGLYSADFRAPERLAQTVIQVAGRAGRGDTPGRVILQTHLPEHPLLLALQGGAYATAATQLLRERQQAGLPPFRALALLQAEAQRAEPVYAFLCAAHACIGPELECSGPIPALLERRAGYHRAYLWLEGKSRSALHRALSRVVDPLGKLPQSRRVRWSLDVDPQNF